MTRDSQTLGLDREEAVRFLAAAEAASARDHALACLLTLNGLRVSEACAADIVDLGVERAHRVLAVAGKGGQRTLVPCGVGVNCHKMRGRNGTRHRSYYCRNHDPLRAGGEQHRCTERNIRSDALDGFVFDQVRQALLRPEVLLAGERAVATRAPTLNDELLAAQLARLERRAEAAQAERRRLVDLYQAGLIELVELQRRAKELDGRRRSIAAQHQALTEQRDALAKDNRLRQRIGCSPSGQSPPSTAWTSTSANSCSGPWSRRCESPAGSRHPTAYPTG